MKIFVTLCIYMIALFLYRVLVMAKEYDSRVIVFIEVGLDVLCLVVLFRLKKSVDRNESGKRQHGGLVKTLFVIVIMSGFGSLALRMNGDNGWWTGHLRYVYPEHLKY